MKEKIGEQRILVGQLWAKLKEEEDILAQLITQYQKACPHKYTKKIYSAIKGNSKRGMILKGTECKDCGKFFQSKVWDEYRPKVDKYCEVCDGEVEFEGHTGSKYDSDVKHHYKCKICGHKQSEFIG